MLQAGTLASAAGVAPPRASANRRLAWGLLVSLLFHALLLSLQFGVPGMALRGARSAIHIVLAPALSPPAEPVPADPGPDQPLLPPRPAPVTGMRLVDPAARPLPAPRRPKAIGKARARKAPRISTPLPQPDADMPARVIAQASKPDSEFIMPPPQPEEALQKTIDPAEAQHGSDDVAQAPQEEAALPELEQPVLAVNDAAEEQLRMDAAEARNAALAERQREILAQQRLAQEMAERRKLEEQLAERRAQEMLERQMADELLAQQRRAQELAERQKSEQLLAQQRRDIALAEREAALARAVPPGDPFGAADGQGGSGQTRGSAGNYGSDLSNRVRDLSKGLDLLTGAPPARARPNEMRESRRVVADSADRDVPLRMYVESWRQKIERNGNMNFPKLIGERARIDPLVSVAVRSDGSIEDVTIVRSSGRQDTDEAVRRIVRINALYSRFPPNIASRYDVIEIRRIWTFDQVLKLIEEVR